MFGDNGDNNAAVDYADSITGGAGDDYVQGDAGNDTVSGGAGNDTVVGGFGNDVLNGEAGNDTLAGNGGDDRLYGGDGRDNLHGHDGQDYLDAGYWTSEDINEAEILNGGNGGDVFVRHTHWLFGDDPDVFADFDGADNVEIN